MGDKVYQVVRKDDKDLQRRITQNDTNTLFQYSFDSAKDAPDALVIALMRQKDAHVSDADRFEEVLRFIFKPDSKQCELVYTGLTQSFDFIYTFDVPNNLITLVHEDARFVFRFVDHDFHEILKWEETKQEFIRARQRGTIEPTGLHDTVQTVFRKNDENAKRLFTRSNYHGSFFQYSFASHDDPPGVYNTLVIEKIQYERTGHGTTTAYSMFTAANPNPQTFKVLYTLQFDQPDENKCQMVFSNGTTTKYFTYTYDKDRAFIQLFQNNAHRAYITFRFKTDDFQEIMQWQEAKYASAEIAPMDTSGALQLRM